MREECRMEKMFFVAGLAAVAVSATLPAAVVESTDPDTGYKVLTVAAGEFAEYATVLDASVPGLIKRGTGTAWLTGANSAFVGPIQIEEGVLGGSNGAFGKTGNLTVSNGATLDVTKQANSAMNTRKVFFEGVGSGGIGAIICTNASGYSNRDAMFKNVEMTGDATWASGARHGMSSGTFTMNGHTLTKIGSGTLSLFQSVSQPGHFMLNKGELLAQSGAKLNGDASNTITANGGYLNMWCLNYSTELINWTYVTKGSASLYAGGLHANRTGYNQYAGPISIEGSQLTIYMNNTDRKLSLTGPITTGPGGTGKLIKSGSGDGGDTWIMNRAQLGSVSLAAGGLHFVDADVTVSNAYTYITRSTSARVPVLTLTNVTWVAHPQPADKYGKTRNPNQILVGGDSANTWGLLEIFNDTTVTNDISIGYGGSLGAIHQSGARSKVYTRATTSNDGYIGYGTSGGYGYWGLTDGTAEIYAHTTVGLHTNSVGFIVMHGGLFKMLKDSWKFSKGGHAELYVTDGGTFDGGTSAFTFGSQDYSDTTGGKAVITADGASSLIKLNGTTWFQWRTNFWSQINVRNGGVVQLKNLSCRAVGLAQAGISEAYVGFDGGTVRLTSDAGNIFGSATSHAYDPTAVVVYSGGATIETEAANAVWTAPLVRPTGQSITSITLPSEVLTSTNALGPMCIRISGNGHGATAIADYEDATRQTKGAIVTSPGYGYDNETTVTIDAWNRKSKLPCTYTLGEVAGGGFTKKGGGKLTLKGANTYAGATRLEGGTLVFTDPNGYPGGDLEIAAAAVQGQTLAAPLLTADTLAFAEGKGVRVTEADTLDDKTYGAMKTVATFTNPITLPSLTLADADGTVWANNRQWCLMLADGGRTLKFGPLRGTQILLK